MRVYKAERILIFSIAFGAAPCVGQSDGSAPLVLELPASTRALGLGGAFVLSVVDNDAVFYHPGLLDAARGAGLAVQRYRSSSTMGVLSAATEWFGGGLALGVQVLSYGAGGPALDDIPDDANELLSSGSSGVSELVGSLGYGREILGFRAGIVGKVIEQRVGGERDATVAIDVGIVRSLWGVTLGASAQNLGWGLRIGSGDLPLPSRVTVAASTRSRPVGPLDVRVVAHCGPYVHRPSWRATGAGGWSEPGDHRFCVPRRRPDDRVRV